MTNNSQPWNVQDLVIDKPNRKSWKMQDHIDLKLMCEFQLQLHIAKLNKKKLNVRFLHNVFFCFYVIKSIDGNL